NDLIFSVVKPVEEFDIKGKDENHVFSQNVEAFLQRTVDVVVPEVLFRYVVATDEIYYYGALQQLGELPSHVTDYQNWILKRNIIYDEDVETFLDFTKLVATGVERPLVYRLYAPDGEPVWYKKEYILCRDKNGQVTEAIGKLTNVQSEKELEHHANQDPLTGCLRKHSFETVCSCHLEANSGGHHALMMVDLDNFKAVNDNLGHQFGDTVLRGVGEKLRALFRSSDFVGRIGGDEFMVFMKDVPGRLIVEQKAQDILRLLDTTFTGINHSYRVSSSVGIATYPGDGLDFKALYDHADIALYDAKNRGKNDFVFYHNQLSKGTMENTMPFDVAARTLSQYYDSKIVAETFNLLFESKDLDISMQAVLKSIGNRFATSRVYIFELNQNEPYGYANTYEWCAPGISAEIEGLQCVPESLLRPFFGLSNMDGILYCNDLNVLESRAAYDLMAGQNIKSFLHAYIGPKNLPAYLVGFDDCLTTRVWRPIEISTLLYVSKIIAQFLSGKKAMQDATVVMEERVTALDSVNFNAYIIDKKTYELTFFNKRMKEQFPDIEVGALCYKVLRGKDGECENCPLKTMRRTGDGATRSVIYNEQVQRYFLTNATQIVSYDGQEGIFMAANDVSNWVNQNKDLGCDANENPESILDALLV
ncbi:MAG: GGDEF domain-containing protein, partial [Eubacteriales bacterium]